MSNSPSSHRAFHAAAVALFALVALAQGLRAASGLTVVISGYAVPPLASLGIAIIAALLAFWGWRTRP
jgi:hypothetical protein